MNIPTLSFVAAVTDDATLARDLRASPVVAEAVADGRAELILERGHDCASRALNAGMARTAGDLIVCVRPDVFLPRGWENRLAAALDELQRQGLDWSVLGVAGVTGSGAFAGHLYSSGAGREIGAPLPAPRPAISLDDLLLVIRRGDSLRFDEDLPGFHLHGTDIVQTALDAGRAAYVFHGPVVDNGLERLRIDPSFVRAYRFMQRKWRDRLPIPTSALTITRGGWPLRARRLLGAQHALLGRPLDVTASPTPALLARELGYEAA